MTSFSLLLSWKIQGSPCYNVNIQYRGHNVQALGWGVGFEYLNWDKAWLIAYNSQIWYENISDLFVNPVFRGQPAALFERNIFS